MREPEQELRRGNKAESRFNKTELVCVCQKSKGTVAFPDLLHFLKRI